jgi:hypothetical protein
MLASELIAELSKLIEKHGDCPVYSGGTDYPEEVEDIEYRVGSGGYIPGQSFVI